MTMPWSCDVLKEAPERYASLRFRRFQSLNSLDMAELYELAAFMETMKHDRACMHIFRWRGDVARARKVRAALKDHDVVKVMVDQNLAGQTVSDGLLVLKAMQEGGWVQQHLPPCVRMSMLALRDDGLSMPKIAQRLGVRLETVKNVVNPRRVADHVPLARAGLVAV